MKISGISEWSKQHFRSVCCLDQLCRPIAQSHVLFDAHHVVYLVNVLLSLCMCMFSCWIKNVSNSVEHIRFLMCILSPSFVKGATTKIFTDLESIATVTMLLCFVMSAKDDEDTGWQKVHKIFIQCRPSMLQRNILVFLSVFHCTG